MEEKDAEISRLRNELEQAQQEVDEVLESTKEIEAQLELDVTQAEKQLANVRRKNDDLSLDVQDWKERFTKAQKEYEAEVSLLQKELKETKNSYHQVRSQLRDEELKHDDLERQERIVTTSYQDLEEKFHEALERNANLEVELEERNSLREECQRLKDEIRDLGAEMAVMKSEDVVEPRKQKSKILAERLEMCSPPGSDRSNSKQSYFVNAPVAIYSEAGVEHLTRPASRLATLNSVKNIQSLSTTIAALREKMRAARGTSGTDGDTNIPYRSVLPRYNLPTGISKELSMSTKEPEVSHLNGSPTRDLHNKRRQSGIPTPDQKRPSLVQAPLIRQYGPRPGMKSRQGCSPQSNSIASPSKYAIASGMTSPTRRRSNIPSSRHGTLAKLSHHSFTEAGLVETQASPSKAILDLEGLAISRPTKDK